MADFDPDAPIPSLEDDPTEFDDELAREAIRRKLVATAAGQGPDDFTYFDRLTVADKTVTGNYSFRVVQNDLKEALATTSLTADPPGKPMSTARVTLFRERLRLQTFTQAAFTEYFVPLVEPSPSIPLERADDLAVAFVIDQKTFYNVVRTVPDREAILEFTYHVATELLRGRLIIEGVLHLDHQLSCLPRTDFN